VRAPEPGVEPTGRAGGAGDECEPPPVLGTWPRLYALVIGALILEIALLALLSRSGG
jgi:hypothetical protein